MDLDITAPVGRFFAALTARDFSAARTPWASDGAWHVIGEHDLVGDYSADGYIEMLVRWFSDHPAYAAVDFEMTTPGTDVVVVHLVTENGAAPGQASGIMMFRIRDDLIVEGWAIPTFAGGRYPF